MLGAAVVAVFLLSGCNKGANLRFKAYEESLSEAAFPGSSDSISVSVRLEYPVGGAKDEAIHLMTSSILGRSIDAGNPTASVEEAIKEYVDVTVQGYKDAYSQISEEYVDEDETWGGMSWEDVIDGYFAGSYKKLVSYIVEAYSYEGGANGLEGVYAVLFDTTTGEVVSEEDFFNPGYEEILSSALSSRLEESMKNPEDYDALFVKDIEPNGNFYVMDDGVTYVYSPFDIGPHSLGTIRVFVPWEDIAGLISRDYR